MREIRARVADTLDDAQQTAATHLPQSLKGGMETGRVVDPIDLIFGDRDVAAGRHELRVLVKRNDRIEAVVPTVELDQDEHTVGLALGTDERLQQRSAAVRLDGEPAEKHRQHRDRYGPSEERPPVDRRPAHWS